MRLFSSFFFRSSSASAWTAHARPCGGGASARRLPHRARRTPRRPHASSMRELRTCAEATSRAVARPPRQLSTRIDLAPRQGHRPPRPRSQLARRTARGAVRASRSSTSPAARSCAMDTGRPSLVRQGALGGKARDRWPTKHVWRH